MTQTEIEAELGSLRTRLSQLEQEQEIKKKEWGKLGLISLFIALAFLAYSVALFSIDLRFLNPSSNSPSWAPLFVIAPLAILIRAFGTPFGTPKRPR